jgi:integrase
MHAGGSEIARDRTLSLDELKVVFKIMSEHQAHFVRENYLAVVLLVLLGVRKGELTAAPWKEIDLDKGVWYLPSQRAKNEHAIDIPLPTQAVTILKELKVRAGNSEYVFPSRRASKRRGYISDDTLNHALTNLFGRKTGKLESSTGNILGEASIEYFVIHDLRRTTRTLMSKNKVRTEVAEKCINHVKKGVEGVYNRDAYFDERVDAHQQLANQIAPLVSK